MTPVELKRLITNADSVRAQPALHAVEAEPDTARLDDQLCDAHHEMAQCADRIAVAAADAAYWLEAQGDRLPIALAELRIRVREYRKRQDRADRLHAEWEQVMGVER